VPVFADLSWTVRAGEHWAVCGPNGSGKTTLLSLIVGDHPQAYANTVRVFGKLRGGGSIRELKEGIGLISAELQVRYRKGVTALEVVIPDFRFRRALSAASAGSRRPPEPGWSPRHTGLPQETVQPPVPGRRAAHGAAGRR
jgi:molybdate transport system ATP-binding protein